MKRILTACVLLVGIAHFTGCSSKNETATPEAQAAPFPTTDLRCEYLTDPLGVGTKLPRFSWKLIDPNHTRGQKQTAYQVMVTERGSDTVLWDSGKVASTDSVNNTYAGTARSSGQDCHWKVRV